MEEEYFFGDGNSEFHLVNLKSNEHFKTRSIDNVHMQFGFCQDE